MNGFDPKNFVLTMVFICDTFSLTHEQMMKLRTKVETTYRGQVKPVAARKHTKEPVRIEGIALVVGLCIGFGGGASALKDVLRLSPHKLIDMARQFDPYEVQGDANPVG